MIHALRDVLGRPIGIGILVAAVLAVVLSRTRFARGAIESHPLLVYACAERARFDTDSIAFFGERSDAWDWLHSAEVRAFAGLVVVLLAAPIGLAAARLIGVRRGALLGLAALGPFGAGLVASSRVLLGLVAAIQAEPQSDLHRRLQLLAAAVEQSDRLVAWGTSLSVLVCAGMAFGLLRQGGRELRKPA